MLLFLTDLKLLLSVNRMFFVCCVCSLQTPVDTEDVQPAPNIDHLLSNIGRTALLGEASGEDAVGGSQSVTASSNQADQ